MSRTGLTREQIAERGERIYRVTLRDAAEAQERGRMLVLDIETGDHEIGESGLEAARRLLARHPGADLYALRVGYPAVGRIGGRRPDVAS